MDKKALEEIHAFDNGTNTPSSYFIWSYPDQVPELVKLVVDLLLRFREVEDEYSPVDFTELDQFVEAATQLVRDEAERQVKEISGKVTVCTRGNELEWGRAGRGGDERPPTKREMTWYEGESGMLRSALEKQEVRDERRDIRLFSALGLYSCGRAIVEMKGEADAKTIAAFLSTAGRCLGYSRVISGWKSRSDKARAERQKGGRRPRKENPEKAAALKLAKEHPGLSATQVKLRGRLRASDRTIREWLSEGS